MRLSYSFIFCRRVVINLSRSFIFIACRIACDVRCTIVFRWSLIVYCLGCVASISLILCRIWILSCVVSFRCIILCRIWSLILRYRWILSFIFASACRVLCVILIIICLIQSIARIQIFFCGISYSAGVAIWWYSAICCLVICTICGRGCIFWGSLITCTILCCILSRSIILKTIMMIYNLNDEVFCK